MYERIVKVAEMENLVALMNWVRLQIVRAGIPEKSARKVEVALEEALVNVITHSYGHKKGTVELVAQLDVGDKLIFTIRDQGAPFNPLLHPVQREGKTLEQMPIGGLGIRFMRSCMDEVHYEREHPYNVLTMVKQLY